MTAGAVVWVPSVPPTTTQLSAESHDAPWNVPWYGGTATVVHVRPPVVETNAVTSQRGRLGVVPWGNPPTDRHMVDEQATLPPMAAPEMDQVVPPSSVQAALPWPSDVVAPLPMLPAQSSVLTQASCAKPDGWSRTVGAVHVAPALVLFATTEGDELSGPIEADGHT